MRSIIALGLIVSCLAGTVPSKATASSICNELLKGEIRNPYSLLFEKPENFAEMIRLSSAPLTDDVKAATFWKSFTQNSPELASPEDESYIRDVLEISFGVNASMARYPGIQPDALRTIFADNLLKMSRESPPEKFRLSHGELRKHTIDRVTFGSEVFALDNSVESRLNNLASEMAAPQTWTAIVESTQGILKEISRSRRVSMSFASSTLGTAILNSHRNLSDFRSRILVLFEDLEQLQTLRETYLEKGLAEEAAFEASEQYHNSAYQSENRVHSLLKISVIQLEQMRLRLDMSVVQAGLSYDFLDGLEETFTATQRLFSPSSGIRTIESNDSTHQNLVKLLDSIQNHSKH